MNKRTDDEWNTHLKKVNDCSRYFYKFVKNPDPDSPDHQEEQHFKFFPILCKSNFCPNCSRIKARKVLRSLKKISRNIPFRFFTLTTINTGDVEHDILYIEKCWRKLIKKLQLTNPDIKFFKVLELGKRRNMVHLHGLWNIYIDWIDLSKLWQEISGAYRVNLKTVFDKDGAVGYLGKYLVKTFEHPEEAELFYKLRKRKFSYSKMLLPKDDSKNDYIIYDLTIYPASKVYNEIKIMIDYLDIPPSCIHIDNLFFDDKIQTVLERPPPTPAFSYLNFFLLPSSRVCTGSKLTSASPSSFYG